jgi:hypothetical protein
VSDPPLPPNPFDGRGPFDNTGMKVHRSAVLVGELRQKVHAIEASPAEVETQIDPADPSCWIVRCSRAPWVDPNLGTIVGDIIHNLRSALDNLAWSVVQLGSDPRPKNPRRVEFPMYNSVEEFQADKDGRIPGIRDLDRQILERHQPYHNGDPFQHPFRELDTLWNEDKHRVVVPVIGLALGSEVGASAAGGTVKSIQLTLPPGAAAKVGTEVCRVYVDPPGSPVRLQGRTAIEVHLADGRPVGAVLIRIVEKVTALMIELTTAYGL